MKSFWLITFCGIQGTAANWLRSYLTNRKQKVEIKLSSATPIGEQ
jgi:hypothetical protein